MNYQRKGTHNYYIIVINKRGELDLVHPIQLEKSDRVLFETINKQQWYDFVYYCRERHGVYVYDFTVKTEKLLEMWNAFNKE